MNGENPNDCFLGIERSLTGRRWHRRPGDERLALALAQRLGVPDLIGQVLAARGIDLDSADDFFNPTLKRSLPDPSHLIDMDRAADRIAKAIREGEKVVVFGDYDVDGATSSALLKRFFDAVGGDLGIYIPDRMTEGYGPNAPALEQMAAEGVRLVITVDCGTMAFEALEAGRKAGLEVVVIDHHQAGPKLPPALALVNPNRLDETSPYRYLAAVGLTFLFVVAINRALRGAGWFEDRAAPDLLGWLDMVALGTVCDVVPLVGLNRVLVAQGLKVLGERRNPGLRALCDVAKLETRPSGFHLGYVLGPRINAGGRVGQSDLGARLLTADDDMEALGFAQTLDRLNTERREIENVVVTAAMRLAEEKAAADLASGGNEGNRGGLAPALGRRENPVQIGLAGAAADDQLRLGRRGVSREQQENACPESPASASQECSGRRPEGALQSPRRLHGRALARIASRDLACHRVYASPPGTLVCPKLQKSTPRWASISRAISWKV